jgi:ribose transport system substrate-binding protein
MKFKTLNSVLVAGLLSGGAALTPTLVAAEDKAAPTVALSNAFLGNAWRRSMITAFEEAATQAQKDGLISSFQVANAPGENSATEQIAQLKALLLDQPDILLVNPASPTALNPTLQQACDLGIVVAVFDSSTDLECAYVVSNSFGDWARLSTHRLCCTIRVKARVPLTPDGFMLRPLFSGCQAR